MKPLLIKPTFFLLNSCWISNLFPESKILRVAQTSSKFLATLGLATGCEILSAQSIPVPNFSFESPAAPNTSPYVNIFVDSWQKAPEPAYYGPAIGMPFG